MADGSTIVEVLCRAKVVVDTFFDAKEPKWKPILSLMPKKVFKDKTAKRFWTALAGPERVKP